MKIELDMPEGLGEQLKALILSATKEAIEEQQKRNAAPEWMDLKSGASYAGVSYNTFIKFRDMGLKVAEVQSIKRVSKYEIDRFFEQYSY